MTLLWFEEIGKKTTIVCEGKIVGSERIISWVSSQCTKE